MTIRIKNTSYFIFALAFVIVNLGSLISMKRPIQTGLMISLISICAIPFLTKKILNSKDIVNENVFNFFIILEILSCPLGLFSEYGNFLQNNISLLLYGISYILLPQLLFFNLGRGINGEKISQSLKFLLRCNFFLILIGIYFYIARPQIYLDFIERALPNQFAVYGFAPRLVSYTGDSMSIGVICSSSAILSLFCLNNKERVIFTLIFSIGCIMSMQRGAWMSMIFGMSMFIILTNKIRFNELRINRSLLYILTLIFVGVVYIIYKIQTSWAGEIEFFEIITRRFDKVGGTADERSMQWIGVLNSASRNILGSGLGTLSHKGVDFGFPLVCPDGNYMRILGDTGFLGLGMFVLLNIMSLINTYKNKEWPLFVVIIIYMLQAIGTNVFDLFYSSFIYWYILGLSNRKHKIEWKQPK